MRRRKKSKGGKGKKALKFLLGATSHVLSSKGIMALNSADMLKNNDADGKPKKGLNFKRLAANGAITLGSGIGYVMINNEWVETIMMGTGTASINPTVDTVFAGFNGLNGMGNTNTMNRFLNLYENSELSGANETPNAKRVVDIAGTEKVVKIA